MYYLMLLEQGFSSFCAKFFVIFDYLIKFYSTLSVLHFETSSNLPKKLANTVGPRIVRFHYSTVNFLVPNIQFYSESSMKPRKSVIFGSHTTIAVSYTHLTLPTILLV